MARKRSNDEPAEPGTPLASILKGSTARPLLIGKRTEDEHPQDALARVLTRPSVIASLTAQHYSKIDGETLDLVGLVNALERQGEAVNSGDLSHQEAMLAAQAKTLDLIFHHLARRAAINMGEYIGAADTYMRLALKAQSQCRTTIEALAEIKNPRPVAFVKQANIANGPQQVNNAPTADACAGETENAQSKLLEADSGERLDTRAASPAGAVDSNVAAMGEVNRAPE